jgi:hypothetical protein
MPRQETLLDLTSDDARVEVVKTYDLKYAREAFDSMDESAYSSVWSALGIESAYDLDEIPLANTPEWIDILWEEMLDAAREDGNVLSFFVVNEAKGPNSKGVYVSPDWPSAEAFAKHRITGAA